MAVIRTPASLTVETVRERRAALSRFGAGNAGARAGALAQAAGRPYADVRALVEWHDLLLYVVAHPASLAEHDHARAELDAVGRSACAIAERGSARERRALEESGIAGSTVRANYGLAIARWLVERHPDCVRLDGVDEAAITLAETLAPGLPALQAEIAAGGNPDGVDLPEAFGGPDGGARWLVRAFDRLPASAAIREQLWDRVQPALVVAPGGGPLARTFLRGPAAAPFTVDQLVRDFDVRAAIDEPLPAARRLAMREREHLVDAGRGTLAVLGRETAALSATSARDTRFHPLGRGLAIALHAPARDRRGPLDTHVGFVLYRNAVPIAYGGGWPFAGGCRIGVNVFPAFRGGESAYVFTQVLRAYRARFGVERFVVEPYQYGLGNREGLESGAFWFYWRLGFRPVEPKILALARDESAKIEADRRYRAPIAVLRRFTASDIALELRSGAPLPPEPAALAERASAWLADRARGDPTRAERLAIAAAERLLGRCFPADPLRRAAWIAWAPLLAQMRGLGAWPARARSALASILDAKAVDEFAFQHRLARHRRLRAALGALARGDDDDPV